MSATAASGQRPMTINGNPHIRLPSMNGGLSRLTPVSAKARIAPISAPIPIAELMNPTPPSPSSRSSIATTTM